MDFEEEQGFGEEREEEKCMIIDRNSNLTFIAWFDSIIEIKSNNTKFHMKIIFLSKSSIFQYSILFDVGKIEGA